MSMTASWKKANVSRRRVAHSMQGVERGVALLRRGGVPGHEVQNQYAHEGTDSRGDKRTRVAPWQGTHASVSFSLADPRKSPAMQSPHAKLRRPFTQSPGVAPEQRWRWPLH